MMETIVLAFNTREDLIAAEKLIKQNGIQSLAMTTLETVCMAEVEYVLGDGRNIINDAGNKLTKEEFDDLKMEARDTLVYCDGILDRETMHDVIYDVLRDNGLEELQNG